MMKCEQCGGGQIPVSAVEDAGAAWCVYCSQQYPPALLKATIDQFDYALKFRDRADGTPGEVVRFMSATINGGWITLTPDDGFKVAFSGLPCPRGVDVRLEDIEWVADAPNGS